MRQAMGRGVKLDQNIAHFVRVLRRAGLRIGSAATLQAVEACRLSISAAAANSTMRWQLPCETAGGSAALQSGPYLLAQSAVDGKDARSSSASLTRETEGDPDDDPTSRRIDEALNAARPPEAKEEDDDEAIEIDMSMTTSMSSGWSPISR